jgi:pumilio family protein 6
MSGHTAPVENNIGKGTLTKSSKRSRSTPRKRAGDSKDGKKQKTAPSIPLGQRDSKRQRALLKPFGDMVQEAKELWNKLREKTVGKEAKAELVDKIMILIDTKIYEIIARHDASRVIQACFRYGSEEAQKKICSELKDHYFELSLAAYGHFMLKSMLRHAKKQERIEIVAAFKGNFCKMATHVTGASVLELLYQNRGGRDFQREIVPKGTYKKLAREFYGREFQIFSNAKEDVDMRVYLAENPDRRDGVLGDMKRLLDKQISKGLHHLEFSQAFLCEYVQLMHDAGKSIEPLLGTIADSTLQFASTYPGSTVVVHALTYGNAKIRKQIVKQLRGRSRDVLKHPHGYLAVLKALDCVDDTVLLKKNILADALQEADALKELVQDENSSKILLHLLAPGENRYLNSRDISMLALVGETSKKDKSTRREELLPALKDQLESLFASDYEDLLVSAMGAKIFYEGVKLWGAPSDGVEKKIASFLKKQGKKIVLNKSQLKELQKLLKK